MSEINEIMRELLTAHVTTAPQPVAQRLFATGVPRQLTRTAMHSPCRRAGWDGASGLVQAMMLGCIPVIIQPGVHQYFQDFLPYRK